ncbi:MAG: hypothetical protein HY906_25305, partial [Deltaproteobacteria bacterium]|nr:hypothetical protein [Deltaproteobacteria bacterium]
MDLWDTIRAFVEGHWGYGLVGLVSLAALAILVVRRAKLTVRNVRRMPAELYDPATRSWSSTGS